MTTNFSEKLNELAATGNLRGFRPLGAREGCRVEFQGKSLLNLTSNDYLGLATNKQLHRDFYRGLEADDFLEHFALGAASSRLLTGDSHPAHQLEQRLSQLYQRPACLLFNSGYHANIGILPALTGKGDLILLDKLNHASIHDGLNLSRATHKRFRHADYDHLVSILEREREAFDRVVIVTESVFSMDGDEANLPLLVAIKKKYDCLLYVDEAHSVGLYGKNGLGKAEEHNLVADVDLLVGTFGKAWASVGAFVVCTRDIYDYLVNFSRSLIFTTALPPVVTAWNLYILEQIIKMQAERERLSDLSQRLRRSLVAQGLRTAGSTNILPVMIGDNQRAVQMAQRMQNSGYLIFAVRPPTVPQGTARFRLSLTANMDWEQLEPLPQLISDHLEAG